jgi:hypothetical protein
LPATHSAHRNGRGGGIDNIGLGPLPDGFGEASGPKGIELDHRHPSIAELTFKAVIVGASRFEDDVMVGTLGEPSQ